MIYTPSLISLPPLRLIRLSCDKFINQTSTPHLSQPDHNTEIGKEVLHLKLDQQSSDQQSSDQQSSDQRTKIVYYDEFGTARYFATRFFFLRTPSSLLYN